jgi:hypothetical protein
MSMNSAMKSFPFYNVVKYGKGEYGIELGLAGFNKKNVKVQYKDGVLTISGQVNDSEKEYVEKGLAARKVDAPVKVIPYPPVCGVPTINLTGDLGSCIFLIAFCLSSVEVSP